MHSRDSPLAHADSDLVASGLPFTASTFELPPLGAHVRLRAAVRNTRGLTEMALCLSRFDRAAEEHRALAQRRAERKLVERQALSTCLHDACTSGLSEAKSADSDGRHIVNTLVISDSSHHDSNFTVFVLHCRAQLG